MSRPEYVHGYTPRETARLLDQAATLTGLLHAGTSYPEGSRVLEIGCGVGAQTLILVDRNPGVRLFAVDISRASLRRCRERLAAADLSRASLHRHQKSPPDAAAGVHLLQTDLLSLPFSPESFDHVFLCFVLEHLPDPEAALLRLKAVLNPQGTLTAIEGDHGSAYFHPDSVPARRAIECLVELQARAGGDSLIGRRLYPLFAGAGLRQVRVSPCVVYADGGRPEMAEGFTRNTFAAMVEGVGERALAAGLIDEPTWRQGVADLYRTALADGSFSYTFFKAVGTK